MAIVREVAELGITEEYLGLWEGLQEVAASYGVGGNMENAVFWAYGAEAPTEYSEELEVRVAWGRGVIALANLIQGDVEVPVTEGLKERIAKMERGSVFEKKDGKTVIVLKNDKTKLANAMDIAYPRGAGGGN